MSWSTFSEIRQFVRNSLRGRTDRRFRARFDTSDVAQEASIQAWLYCSTENDAPDTAWLRLVARRQSANLHEFHAAKRRSVLTESAPQNPVQEAGCDIGQSVLVNEQIELLLAAMTQLPAVARRILHLRFVEQGSFKEIARTINQPEHRVRRQYHAALRQLRSDLESASGAKFTLDDDRQPDSAPEKE